MFLFTSSAFTFSSSRFCLEDDNKLKKSLIGGLGGTAAGSGSCFGLTNCPYRGVRTVSFLGLGVGSGGAVQLFSGLLFPLVKRSSVAFCFSRVLIDFTKESCEIIDSSLPSSLYKSLRPVDRAEFAGLGMSCLGNFERFNLLLSEKTFKSDERLLVAVFGNGSARPTGALGRNAPGAACCVYLCPTPPLNSSNIFSI